MQLSTLFNHTYMFARKKSTNSLERISLNSDQKIVGASNGCSLFIYREDLPSDLGVQSVDRKSIYDALKGKSLKKPQFFIPSFSLQTESEVIEYNHHKPLIDFYHFYERNMGSDMTVVNGISKIILMANQKRIEIERDIRKIYPDFKKGLSSVSIKLYEGNVLIRFYWKKEQEIENLNQFGYCSKHPAETTGYSLMFNIGEFEVGNTYPIILSFQQLAPYIKVLGRAKVAKQEVVFLFDKQRRHDPVFFQTKDFSTGKIGEHAFVCMPMRVY